MLTISEALIHAMVLVSGSDRDMTDIELRHIGRLVKDLPAFADYDVNHLPDTARECAVVLQLENGLDRCLDLIARALPPRLRETAYLLACELAAIDRKVEIEESGLLRRLRQHLDIPGLEAAALERATMARLATGPDPVVPQSTD
jgi:hypothetical protein